MKSSCRIASRLWGLAAIAGLIPLSLSIEILSIDFTGQHNCIPRCLRAVDSFSSPTGFANVMGCNTPVDNICYCATATESLVLASSWMGNCASSACSTGDIPQDLKSMHFIYASYCVQAGITQPGATALLAQLTTSQAVLSTSTPQTVTDLSLVTRTSTPVTSDGEVLIPPQVTVNATSTVWTDGNGNIIPDLNLNDGASASNLSRKLGVGLGVGLGIPIIAALSFGVWFCRRRNRSTVPPIVTARAHSPNLDSVDQKLELDGGRHRSTVIHPRDPPAVRSQNNVPVDKVTISEAVVQELPSTEWKPELSSSPNANYSRHR